MRAARSPALARRSAARWSVRDVVTLVSITVAGGVLRLTGLGRPAELVFDEVYYAKDSCWYVIGARSVCGVAQEQTGVHPPLGKWLIGAGIQLFGYDSFGWRIAAAVAGTATIALTYWLAHRLLASTTGAAVSAGLLALDPLHFVQSRVAMLDVFVAAFGVAMFTFLVVYRDRRAAGTPGRPWLAAAGVAAGAAMAAKWSGILVAAAAPVLAVVWAVGRQRGSARPRLLASVVRADGGAILLWLVLLPVAVYVASYTGRLHGELLAWPGEAGSWWRALWDRQLFMYDFHRGLESSHPYQSPPWSWPLLKRPVSYFFEQTGSGAYREVLATGSPLVWWSSLAALGAALGSWILRHDQSRPEGIIVAGFAFAYGPWLVLSGHRSAVFLFYLLPAVPFMCLAIGAVAARLARSVGGSVAVGAFCIGAAALFAFYHPLLAGSALPYEDWRARIWQFDSCEKPAPVKTTTTATTTRAGGTRVETITTRSNAGLPPRGWCWI